MQALLRTLLECGIMCTATLDTRLMRFYCYRSPVLSFVWVSLLRLITMVERVLWYNGGARARCKVEHVLWVHPALLGFDEVLRNVQLMRHLLPGVGGPVAVGPPDVCVCVCALMECCEVSSSESPDSVGSMRQSLPQAHHSGVRVCLLTDRVLGDMQLQTIGRCGCTRHSTPQVDLSAVYVCQLTGCCEVCSCKLPDGVGVEEALPEGQVVREGA